MPLLPSLSDLVIVDADASIAHLELLLAPSLKSLKALCIPDTQQSGFFSFLTALEQEAPLLQTLIFGSGRFESSSLQIIYQFNNLCHLELKNDNSELPFAFFDNIGSLPKLKTFILDACYVLGTMTTKKTIDIDVPTPPPFLKDPDSLPSDSLPNSNLVDGKSDVEGASDALVSQTSCTPTLTTGPFDQLAKLHVTGWLPMLEDLIPRITSTRLGDVSVTLIHLSYEELQVSLAKEKVEQERIAGERRKREEAEAERVAVEAEAERVVAEAEAERVAVETAEKKRWKEEVREEIRRIEKKLKNKKAEEKEVVDMFWGMNHLSYDELYEELLDNLAKEKMEQERIAQERMKREAAEAKAKAEAEREEVEAKAMAEAERVVAEIAKKKRQKEKVREEIRWIEEELKNKKAEEKGVEDMFWGMKVSCSEIQRMEREMKNLNMKAEEGWGMGKSKKKNKRGRRPI